MEKIKELIKKVLTREVILYILFGVLSTIVNLGSFYIFTNFLKWEENISNIIAILFAILFAYFTNKDMVFHSEVKKIKQKIYQFGKFMAGRAFTMFVEWGGCALLFLTPIPQMVTKLIMTVIVVILNYFISKFFAFKNKN